jgi:hypothetical protein
MRRGVRPGLDCAFKLSEAQQEAGKHLAGIFFNVEQASRLFFKKKEIKNRRDACTTLF